MKSFGLLTRLGKIRRMRAVALEALRAYGLDHAEVRFQRFAGNTVYRVTDAAGQLPLHDSRLFEPNRYVLRVHSKMEQGTDAIRLELAWLKAIRDDVDLPVPEPVPNLKGDLLTQVRMPDSDELLDCSLLRWVRGRYARGNGQPHHYRSQGRVMAQLHNHAAGWQHPVCAEKRRFDWKGMYEANVGAKISSKEAWPLVDEKFVKTYRRISDEVKELMGDWGAGPDVFGLIHADCGLDANVLFDGGEARIIDFDGSGYGYWMYDLAITTEHCWDTPDYRRFREAILEGYSEHRTLSQVQLDQWELFQAAFYLLMGLWKTALFATNPERVFKELREWQEHGLKYMKRYLKNR